MEEALKHWQSHEHRRPEKQRDWFWILGIIAVAGAVLAFYFDNTIFGIFILIAGLALGLNHYRKPDEVSVTITGRGITFGKYLYPFASYRSFWIEDDHIHGPRILMHPTNNFLPLLAIPISEDEDIDDVRDILLEFLHEEFLEESLVHKLFDKLGI